MKGILNNEDMLEFSEITMIGVDKSRVPEPMIHLLFITTLRELIHELLTSKDSYAWSTHSAPCFHQGQLRPPRRNEKPSPMSHKGKSKQDKIGRWNTGWCYFAQEIFEGKVMKVYPQNENKQEFTEFSQLQYLLSVISCLQAPAQISLNDISRKKIGII